MARANESESNNRMTIGLTLGKFAPLHRGHQQVIETSLAEMDHTIVLIYDMPGMDTPPLPVRARWLRDLYPEVEVLEAWDGPTETGLDPSVTAKHDAYLRRRFSGRRVTHFYSSEPYGEHVSQALGAINRQVDPLRSVIPISATEIRANPYLHRAMLAPRVYADLILKVVFVGAPSTGKSTLASTLAQHYTTLWMPEYGREYWEKHQVDRRLTQEQLVEIAVGHREREDLLVQNANRFLFIDTDASTTLQFSYHYHDDADPRLVQLAQECHQRYDVVFLCDDDIPYDDTWDRSGVVSREVMQRRVISDLQFRKRPYFRISGTLEERCDQVRRALQRMGFPERDRGVPIPE